MTGAYPADTLDAELWAILRKFRVTCPDPAGLAEAIGLACEAYVQAALREARRRTLADTVTTWPAAGASPARGRPGRTPRKVNR